MRLIGIKMYSLQRQLYNYMYIYTYTCLIIR